jgi:hypothetical protein
VEARRQGESSEMTQKSEESRGVWFARWSSDLALDLRYSFRGMRRDAGFTAFAILITGLGIGASSTVFSIVNAVLLRPLPFRDPGRLVSILNAEWNTQVRSDGIWNSVLGANFHRRHLYVRHIPIGIADKSSI